MQTNAPPPAANATSRSVLICASSVQTQKKRKSVRRGIQQHFQRGERLLAEKEDRYRFWVLTGCALPGEERFDELCLNFDERARLMNRPTLGEIEQISTVCE